MPDCPAPALRAAFWKHQPVADQAEDSLVAATLAFQAATGSPLAKLTPAGNYQIAQRGGCAEWCGDALGRRSFLHRCIHEPADWAWQTRQPLLTPLEQAMVRAAAQLRQHLPPDVPLLATVFPPLTLAAMLAGPERLHSHLARAPQAVAPALHHLNRSVLALVAAYRQAGVAGVYLACQHLQEAHLPEADYRRWQLQQWDAPVLDACGDLPLNLLHLHGDAVHLAALPHQGHWHVHFELHPANPSPETFRAASRLPAVLGLPTALWDAPAELAAEVQQLLQRFQQTQAWLTAPCVVPQEVPEAQIANWVRQAQTLPSPAAAPHLEP